MRISILSPGYPSEKKKYNYTFVHQRAKLYENEGHAVRVFLIGKQKEYQYEGIDIIKQNNELSALEIIKFSPDVICVHSPQYFLHGVDMFKLIEKIEEYPMIIWLLGWESVKSKYYPSRINSFKDLLLSPYREFNHMIQLRKMKNLMKKFTNQPNKVFVFISKWLQKTAAESLGVDTTNSKVIPFPIDETLFAYHEKRITDVYKMLSVRPLNNRKYANDITINAMGLVNKGSLDLYGKGYLYNSLKRLAKRKKAKVNIINEFIEHSKIPEIHKRYGLYISPSRNDAQGISTCEAMASGLPVISSNVGGIPEFVKEGMGFLCDSPEEIARRIRELQDSPSLYIDMSRKAASEIRKICGSNKIIKEELGLLKEVTK